MLRGGGAPVATRAVAPRSLSPTARHYQSISQGRTVPPSPRQRLCGGRGRPRAFRTTGIRQPWPHPWQGLGRTFQERH